MTGGAPPFLRWSARRLRLAPVRAFASAPAGVSAAAHGLVAALLLLVMLAGCSSLSLPFAKDADDANEVPLPAAAASSPDAPAPGASAPASGVAGARAAYRIEVNAPNAIKRLLVAFLDLSRFQNAPEAEGITPLELDRLVAAAPSQARGLLETEGDFNAKVTVTKIAAPGEALPLLRIDVDRGPRTRVGTVAIGVQGELRASADAGDAAAAATVAALKSNWALQPADPFTQTAWNGAKTASLGRLRAEGYPLAGWSETRARVDAERNLADLSLDADSGPLFRLGALRIEGLQRYDDSAVRNLADFEPGVAYSEKRLLDYQDRLQRVGLFEGAIVEIDPDPATAKSAPVVVRVKELQQHQATVGVGVSANTGPRFTLDHYDRKVFGRPLIAHNNLELGTDRQYAQTEIDTYPLKDLYRNLALASVERLRTDTNDELRTTGTLRLGRSQDREALLRLYYGEVVFSRLDTPLGATNDTAVDATYQWIFRNVDNILLPTRGTTLNLQTGAGYAFSNEQKAGPFARLYGRLTWYQPFGGWFATSRLELGQVIAKESVGVPDPLLFRAGGDDSVRGYAYRSLGPEEDDVVLSGRKILTASAELAHPLLARHPEFLGAVFVDAGNAGDHWKGLDPVLGYGVGVRWRSPVGLLRVDLAYGQEVQKFRVHLSVGVTF